MYCGLLFLLHAFCQLLLYGLHATIRIFATSFNVVIKKKFILESVNILLRVGYVNRVSYAPVWITMFSRD